MAFPEMLDVRASVLDPLCGSLDSLWAQHTLMQLSQGSDLQSLVYTLVLLAGGHLPWEAAATAGMPRAIHLSAGKYLQELAKVVSVSI